jgi:hypothetical protein
MVISIRELIVFRQIAENQINNKILENQPYKLMKSCNSNTMDYIYEDYIITKSNMKKIVRTLQDRKFIVKNTINERRVYYKINIDYFKQQGYDFKTNMYTTSKLNDEYIIKNLINFLSSTICNLRGLNLLEVTR